MIALSFRRSDGRCFYVGLEENPVNGLTNGDGWGLMELEGVDAPRMEVFTQKRAWGDGDVITGTRIAGREVVFKAKCKDPQRNQVLRHEASAFFVPEYSFDITIKWHGAHYLVSGCKIKALAMRTGNIYHGVVLECSLYCPTPYMSSVVKSVAMFKEATPLLAFPAYCTPDRPLVMGEYAQGNEIVIFNRGEARVGLAARLVASGDVVKPSIMVNDAKVCLNCRLVNGDVITFDSEKVAVWLNGVNAGSLLSEDSELERAWLDLGANDVVLSADEGVENLSGQFTYNFSSYGVR